MEVIANGFEHLAMRKLVRALQQDINAGISLASALRKNPAHFDALFCNLIEAGEQAGALEVLLDRVATYKEKTETLKKKIKKAMTYPITVLVVALAVCGILLIEVVPQFQNVFDSFDAQLPVFTLWVIAVSQALQQFGLWLLGGGCLGIAGLRYRYKHSPALRQRLDRWLLKLPVLGHLLHFSATARFARTLAVTFKAGVPLVEAMDNVAGATGNRVYTNAVYRMRDDVAVGYPLNMAMKQGNLFPNMVVQMTAIGEEAGALDAMLFKVAEFYEEEVDNSVDAISSLIEPFVMVIIGGLVGSIVIAMYLPIFKIAATVMG